MKNLNDNLQEMAAVYNVTISAIGDFYIYYHALLSNPKITDTQTKNDH